MTLPPRPVTWLITVSILFTAVLAAVLCFQIFQPTSQNSTSPTVTIDGHQFSVTIADTPQQQQRGLGGVTHLANNQGMYFPLQGQSNVAFWMKDMKIPIDIIWIKNDHIVKIDANTPAPVTGTPDDQLPLYYSPVPQPDAVLEIAANQAAQLHFLPGDTIRLVDRS